MKDFRSKTLWFMSVGDSLSFPATFNACLCHWNMEYSDRIPDVGKLLSIYVCVRAVASEKR
jgi:hypothetical protein